MREHKFRVWDSKLNKFRYFNLKELIEKLGTVAIENVVGMCSDYIRDEEIQQCTGMKDRSGQDIYEGDIITDSDEDGDMWEVYWDNEDGYRAQSGGENEPLGELYKDCDIIGHVLDGKNYALEEEPEPVPLGRKPKLTTCFGCNKEIPAREPRLMDDKGRIICMQCEGLLRH